MLRKNKILTLMAIPVVLCMGLFSSCDETEDELDSSLVGTWYRYSLMVGSNNYFTPVKTVLNTDGTGVNYLYDIQDDQEVPVTDTFTWEDLEGVLSVYDDEGTLEFTSPYTMSNNGNVITITYDDEGMNVAEVSVKRSSQQDAALTGTWHTVSFTVDGAPIPSPNWVFTMNANGTYTSTGWDTDDGTWSTNSGYFLGVSNDDAQGRDYGLYQYVLTDNDSTVTMTGFEAEYDGESGEMESMAVQIVLSRDSGGGGEIDSDLIGTWHTYLFNLNNGLIEMTLNQPSCQVLNDDGSGTRTYLNIDDPENPVVETEEFTWVVVDDNLMIYNEENELAYYGPYEIVDNTLSITYEGEWEDGFTYTITAFSVKELEEYDTELVGSFVPIYYMFNDVLETEMEYVTFNSDGSLTSSYLDEETVDTYEGTWSTSGNFCIAYTDQYEGLATVMTYEISSAGMLEFQYYDWVTVVQGNFIKNSEEIDSEMVGNWTLTSRTVNGVDDPEMPDDATMTTNGDGTGSGVWDDYSYEFEWSTNDDWFLYLDTAYDPVVGTAYSYAIDGTTMTMTYYEENDASGDTVVDTWTKE